MQYVQGQHPPFVCNRGRRRSKGPPTYLCFALGPEQRAPVSPRLESAWTAERFEGPGV